MDDKFDIVFLDSGREPQCPPNPNYPNGMDIKLAKGHKRRCIISLPYPAPRCGALLIRCKQCGVKAVITVAGRVDDPRTIEIPCKVDA